MDVIAQASITIKAGNANIFKWKGHGFQLHAPEGALPPGLPQCTLHIQASLSGQFHFPQGSALISPVYWISSPVAFSKPLTLEIQHTAHAKVSPLHLKFVKAQCTQKELPYQFKPIENSNEMFTKHRPYGRISTTKFSGFGIITMFRSLFCYSYIGQVLKSVEASYKWKVFFVVTKDLDALKTVSYTDEVPVSFCYLYACSLFRRSLMQKM